MQIQNLLLGYQFTGRRRKYKYKYKRHTSVIKSNHLDTNLTTDSSAVYWEATEIDAISARVWALDNTPLMVWLEIIGPQQFVSVLSTIHLAFPESFVMLVWIGIIGSQQKTVFFQAIQVIWQSYNSWSGLPRLPGREYLGSGAPFWFPDLPGLPGAMKPDRTYST